MGGVDESRSRGEDRDRRRGEQGIGLATVRALPEEGARVAGAARTITPELTESGAVAIAAGLRSADGAAEFVRRAVAELGGVDLLVNNVGGSEPVELAGFREVSDEPWRQVFELNLFSAVRVTRAATDSLLSRRGSVVTVSSLNSRLPAAGPIAYSAAEAALTAWGNPWPRNSGRRACASTRCRRARLARPVGSRPRLRQSGRRLLRSRPRRLRRTDPQGVRHDERADHRAA
ncbi:SDR family NAD(P)-dependent oxidoreductase [Amycolatopsis sp. FDAARGOS 1241]|uniref:SDR family NAD(P)-dependent oxidoreductase n=1 Tax=Amycolatopsis sp. FDAARGOS 1241 TaxID=2778070 RepID=UPI001EF27087|nr:SDR family NAD(P)-dependent oxidoreductase [Amycolatopsis sp. FDAARGOS 1241]